MSRPRRSAKSNASSDVAENTSNASSKESGDAAAEPSKDKGAREVGSVADVLPRSTAKSMKDWDRDIGRVRAHDIPSDGDSDNSLLWANLGRGKPGSVRANKKNRRRGFGGYQRPSRTEQTRDDKENKDEEGEYLPDEGELTTRKMVEILWKERSAPVRRRSKSETQAKQTQAKQVYWAGQESEGESEDDFDGNSAVRSGWDDHAAHPEQGEKVKDKQHASSHRSHSYGYRSGKLEDKGKPKPKPKKKYLSDKHKGRDAEEPEEDVVSPEEAAPGDEYAVQYTEGVERRGWAPAAWPPKKLVVGSVTSRWASAQGIEVGDELLAIDGIPVKRMSKPFLVEGMNRRPVKLTFVRRFEHDEHEYGEYAPPNRVRAMQRKEQNPQTSGIHLGFRGDSHVWKPPWGCTVLHEAAANGNLHLARISIHRSPSMAGFRDSHGRTPLHYAAQEGHEALLPVVAGLPEDAYKVELTSDDLFCDAVDFLGCSPLWLATRNGHVPCCKWLLDRRADPMRRARDGTCPIWQAARSPAGRQNPPLTLAVLLASVMPLPFSGSGLYELPRFEEKFLLRDLVDVNGFTLFHAAAYDNAIPVLEWLAKHLDTKLLGMLVAAHARGGGGETALHLAVLNDHLDAADLLRAMGASTLGDKRAHGSEIHDTGSDEDERSKIHREARFNLNEF